MSPKKIIVAVAVLAVLAGGGYALRRRFARPSQEQSITVTATEGPIEETVEATGSVLPLSRVEIKPPMAGRIEKLLVDEGMQVKPGQIIAWMSSTDRAAILDAARAQGPEALQRWEDTYKATPIIASLPGVIILRNVVQGQTIDSSVVLFAMSDTLVTVALVDESDIGRIKKGMPARITLDSYPDRQVEGKVFDILYEGKNVSNVIQYGVKIKIDKVPSYFRSQMTANISFILSRKPNAVLLQAGAIRDAGGGVKQVLVLGEDGKPTPKTVKTGIETDQNVEILEGLAAGDKVIIRQAKYVSQSAPQSSPLTIGGRGPGGPSGQAPRSKK